MLFTINVKKNSLQRLLRRAAANS